MKYLCSILITLFLSGCISFGPPPTVYSFSDSAYSVYTDKQVSHIIYFGSKNHYIFTITDPKIKHLIKNVDKGNLHINFASDFFIQEISDVITTNFFNIRFKVKDASPELIEWARENEIYYDDNTSLGPYYTYQVLLDAKRYLADKDLKDHIKINDPKLSMSFQTLINTTDIKLKPSPVKVINGQPYLRGSSLFELIDYGWVRNSQHRKIIYKENVNH